MSLIEVALDCARRGWHVFPCWPRTKKPMTAHGWHDATVDESAIHEWWTRTPDANVAIACNPSNLCVVDIDHGLKDLEALNEFMRALPETDLPASYAVRTGRRPEFGVQLYFHGAIPDVGLWKLLGCEGQVKSLGGYVMAAGSIHPDSGEAYEVLVPEFHLATEDTPQWVKTLRPERVETGTDEPIAGNRNVALTSIAGKLRNAGLSAEALELALLQVNADRCTPPLEDSEVQRIAANVARYKLPEMAPGVTLATPLAKVSQQAQEGPFTGDWKGIFHSKDETESTPDAEFLVKDFLQMESVTGIIGPARARKSIVTLNLIHSLLTGDKLFGHFEVSNKAERVIYLCPESGIKSLARRIRNLGLAKFVGESFFYTSMNSDPIILDDPRLRAAAKGSVLIIDTAIRFYEGDESDSKDMKRFGAQCHGLIREGVQAVVLLHHTAKNTEGLTLEGARGSGDFGGFLTCCWGTTLEDYEDAYRSQSFLSCVKQRDFQVDNFKVAASGDPHDFVLRYVDGSEKARVVVGGFKGNRDGKDDAALALLAAHPKMSSRESVELLASHDIKRGKDWVQHKRAEMVQKNGGMMP